MRILHCCLSCFYIDKYSYQENLLPKCNLMHGHQVEIIASTEIFTSQGEVDYVQPATYHTEDGIKITRVPYSKWLPHFIMKKVRSYKGVYSLIDDFKPDIIMFHGMAAFELINVVKYVKKHTNVKLYVDSHEDHNNSGTNFISKYMLHKTFYRKIIQKSMSYISKVFYITEECKDFITKEYKVPREKTEFLPLGGTIVSKEEKESIRKQVREDLRISEDTLVVMHSGKLDELKRTDILIEAIDKVKSENVCLLIAGTIPPENIKLKRVIENSDRVRWLGWLNASDLRNYLCASDIYAQPGSQSATAQNAICCGVPLLLYPHKSYLTLCKGNALWVKESDEICTEISRLIEEPAFIRQLSEAAFILANSTLDYNVLASRIEK